MAIEIIPKEEKKILKKSNVLLYLSLLLLIISLLAYFGLNYWQEKSEEDLQNLKALIAEKEIPERKALEKKIKGYQRKINDFPVLLNSHQQSSNLFSLFESLSHPQVFFSKFDLDVKTSQLSLSGQTDNFQTLGQQLLILRKEKFIKKADLVSVLVEKEGKIEFSLKISLDPQVFKF